MTVAPCLFPTSRDFRGALCPPARDHPVQRSGESGSDEPREGSEDAERRNQSYDDRHGCCDPEDPNGPTVDTTPVPVWRSCTFPVEAIDLHVPSPDDVVVDDDDAEERPEKGPEAAQKVVYGHGAAVDVPGRNQES